VHNDEENLELPIRGNMPEAALSTREVRRLAAVQKLRLLGTPAEERFDRITRLAQRVFDVPMACLDIVGEKLAWLKSVQGFDAIEGLRKDSYCHHTVLNDKICVIRDARVDPRVHDSAFADSWVFYAGVPLRFDGERIGVLCIGDFKPRDYDVEGLDALCDLADLAERELQIAALSESQISLALNNDELEMKSRIDVVTHLWNQSAILDIAAAEAKRASTGSSMAVLMIDIDYFENINHSFGHLVGDEVLRVVAARLRAAVRPQDAVGRYGAEEFLVVLSEAGMEGAAETAERIRDGISRRLIQSGEHKIQVTCSVGCSAFCHQTADGVKPMIERAGRGLYRAKLSGRNRVEIAAAC
jgi:diguanylate cyclase (GGDEF)-like protein